MFWVLKMIASLRVKIEIDGWDSFSSLPNWKTDRSKAVLLLSIFYALVLSWVCYVFVRVCLYVLCGHLLGKG